jgi:hypothetical protein
MLSDNAFFNAKVEVIIPKFDGKMKAEKMMDQRKTRLLQMVDEDAKKDLDRGVHFVESRAICRIRALSFECLQLLPWTGCPTLIDRASYWAKLVMIKDMLPRLIEASAKWDAHHKFP